MSALRIVVIVFVVVVLVLLLTGDGFHLDIGGAR